MGALHERVLVHCTREVPTTGTEERGKTGTQGYWRASDKLPRKRTLFIFARWRTAWLF